MSITEISRGKWKVRVVKRVEGRSSPVGRQCLVEGSKADAKRAEKALEAEFETIGSAPVTEPITVEKILDMFKEVRDLDKGSINCIGLIKKRLGRHYPTEELSIHLTQWIGEMRTAGLSNGTINRRIAWLKAGMNYAVKLRLLKFNPIEAVDRLKERPREVTLTPLEEQRLIEAANSVSIDMGRLIRFALTVPIRLSEITELLTADIDLAQMVIRVRRMKGGAVGWKPIPEEMTKDFKAIVSEGNQFIFPLSAWDMRNGWDTVREVAKLPDLHFHDLRHVAVTKLANMGNSTRVIMAAAGWTSDMMKVYYHRDDMQSVKSVVFKKAV